MDNLSQDPDEEILPTINSSNEDTHHDHQSVPADVSDSQEDCGLDNEKMRSAGMAQYSQRSSDLVSSVRDGLRTVLPRILFAYVFIFRVESRVFQCFIALNGPKKILFFNLGYFNQNERSKS